MFHRHLGLIGIHVWRLTAPTATKAKTVVEKVERKRPGRSHPTLLHVDGHDGMCSEMTPKKKKLMLPLKGCCPSLSASIVSTGLLRRSFCCLGRVSGSESGRKESKVFCTALRESSSSFKCDSRFMVSRFSAARCLFNADCASSSLSSSGSSRP